MLLVNSMYQKFQLKLVKLQTYMYFYIVGFCNQEFHTNNYKFAGMHFQGIASFMGKALLVSWNSFLVIYWFFWKFFSSIFVYPGSLILLQDSPLLFMADEMLV